MKLEIVLSSPIWNEKKDRQNLKELGFKFYKHIPFNDCNEVEDKGIWFVTNDIVEIEINSFEEMFKFMNEWGRLEFFTEYWDGDNNWKARLHYYYKPFIKEKEEKE